MNVNKSISYYLKFAINSTFKFLVPCLNSPFNYSESTKICENK